jgi:hypothetical protein
MKKVVAVLLFLIAMVMIYIGATHSMLPPALTGLGFIGIGMVLLKEKS